MAIQIVNTGTSANSGDGDSIRSAFNKVNANFNELYNLVGSVDTIEDRVGSWLTTANTTGISIGYNTVTNIASFTVTNATTQTIGGIIVGDNLTISNGILSGLSPYVLPVASNSTLGGGRSSTTVLVDENARFFVPPASTSSLGVVSISTGLSVNSGVLSLDLSNINQHVLPALDLTYDLGSSSTQWRSLYVGTGTIYIGGVPITVNQTNNTLIVGALPGTAPTTATSLATESFVIEYVAENAGGGAGPIQPYIELTNSALIIQPVTLGPSVTITAPPQGINATFDVIIGEGPVIESVTVNQPGTLFSVNQIYEIPYFNIGGSDANSSILVTVADVDENGGITTVTNVTFVGTATNSIGSYTNINVDYKPSTFDAIDTGLTLTRDNVRGLFNSVSEIEYNNSTYVSPLGTEWNSDGWSTLVDLRTRSYSNLRSSLNNAIGNNIVSAELVMHDTINDKYYKFNFSAWGQNNGAYAYTRNLITDPNYFEKLDNGNEIDIIVPDDGEGSGIGITRAGNSGIYNPYREESWDSDVSPAGTLWNLDGWDDLSDITERTYQNFYATFGGGGLGLKIPGSKTVMYVPETDEYYAIQWLSWTQGANGGGFSYNRYLINKNKIREGIKFADGTVLKSAAGVGRVKSTATGDRRIEEVTGNNTVSVTQRVINSLTTVASRSAVNSNQVWVDSTTTEIDDIIENPQDYGSAYDFEFSLDNTTWYKYDFGYSSSGNERGFDIWPNTVTYDLGDTIYFRYSTGGQSVVWWDKADLPGGSGNFRGAVIDYHAYTGESTIIGSIHIVDDDGEEHISHQEVQSGSTDGENDDLWLVTTEGQIRYRRIDGEAKTLKVHWTAKVFYGSEYYD